MQIRTDAVGLQLTDEIRRHVNTRFHSALVTFSERVRNVVVVLRNQDSISCGPRTTCAVGVAIEGMREVRVEQDDEDVFEAIDRAADQTGRLTALRVAKEFIVNFC